MNNKIVLIGCGNVGISYAYALVNQHTFVSELVMIDINTEKTIGEVMDLNHCLSYSPSKIKIRLGDYTDCKDAKMVVIAAGVNQAPGETRMDLIFKNASIFKSIIKNVTDNDFKGIYLIATNPLDVMTYLTIKYSGVAPRRVIGSGAVLDTSRLRYMLSERLNMCPKDIDAYVIGEHGDSLFIPWSNANIAFKKITEYFSNEDLKNIEEEVRNSAYEVIKRKGSTSYGIGTCMVRITSAILEDKKIILPASSYDKRLGICISTPTIVGRRGAQDKIDIPLDENEKKKFNESVNVIKEAISKVLDK